VLGNTGDRAVGTAAARYQLPASAWQVGLAAVALALGLIAGVQPALAIGATLGGIFFVLVLGNLATGMILLVVVGFLEQFNRVGTVSLAKIVGALLAVAWLALVAVSRPEERHAADLTARHPALSSALVLFVAWGTMSAVWAERSSAAAGSLVRFTLNLALFPIAFAAIWKRGHVVTLFVVFVITALFSVGYGLTTPPNPNSPTLGRLSGAGLNPNQLGGLLVVAIVFATALAANRRWSPLARGLALAAGGGCAAGLFLTESRGSLVGLGVALVVAPFAAGRGRRALVATLAAVMILGAVGWFEFVASRSALERITHPEKAGGSGREDLWTVGWRMVEAHPVRGVGLGNFPVSSIHYLLRPGLTQRDIYIVDRPLVPHNIYLNVLTELGIVGLLLFITILAIALHCALQAARAFSRRGDPMMEIFARGLFVALVALLAADFFSSQLYNKELWLLLAVTPALRALAERHPAGRQGRLS
jgi:O-antigen ligase